MRVSRRPGIWVAYLLAATLPLVGVLGGTASTHAHATTRTVTDSTAPADDADADSSKADSTEVDETEIDDTEAAPPAELVVAPVSPVLLATEPEAQFRVLLRNTGTHSLPAGSIELSIGEQIVAGSVLAPIGPEVAESDTREVPVVVATEQINATDAENAQELTITVPTEDLPLTSASERGVYPLFATYVESESRTDTTLTAYSPFVWQGTSDLSASVDLTLIVPLVLPDIVHSMPTRPQLEDALPTFESLLDFATRSDAILAIDPRILAAIRGYGDGAPEAAREFLTRLESTELTSFTLQYADADLAAQASLDFEGPLAPNGMDFLTRYGTWNADNVAESESTGNGTDDGTDENTEANTETDPGAETGEPTAGGTPATVDTAADPVTGEPTLDALGAWPQGLKGAWPANGEVSTKTMQFLGRAGLDHTVLSFENVKVNGGPRATLTDGAGPSGSAIITDAELDKGMQLTLQGETGAERELGAAQTTARLALAAHTGVPGLVIGVDRGGIANAEDPSSALEALTSQRWVNTVAFDAQPEGTATLVESAPGEERVALLGTAAVNEDVVLETRALLVHPEYLDSYQRMRLLNLFATRYAAPSSEFGAFSIAFQKRDAELHGGVQLVGTKHAQLVGASSRIPVQLRNPLPFDAIVNLNVAPTSAALSIPERHFNKIALPEDSSEGVLVPVRSRVSSGESAITLTVTSVDGEYTTSTDVLPVTVSTSLETIAIAILVAAALLLFGFGIWRSVRRRRAASGE
ncbi:MAG: DUF6049 family protein [Leucobacter sp.]